MPCSLSASEIEGLKNEIAPLLRKIEFKFLLENIETANRKIYLRFKVKQAKEILKLAKEIFDDNIAVAFSGGKDSLVALHLALQVFGRDIKVIFNNTTVEFPETINYVLSLADRWNLNLKITKSKKPFFISVKEKGWASHENRWCCKPYKERPAHAYMKKERIIAEITGTVRTESIYRRSLKPFKLPKKEPFIIRVNPIYDWNQWEVWRYIKEKKLPYNPLYDKKYRRVGCWCCPLNGPSHYRKLKKTHPGLYNFLLNFKPIHPKIKEIIKHR
ncbi:MAG: phosphoadenosine phosphosulfate reductase family protein [Candidatus Heimdallarchaeaceae archaeon]